MHKIQKEKEKRDRVGPFLGHILYNTSCSFSKSENQNRVYAYKIYQRRREQIENAFMMHNQRDIASEDGEGEEQ